MIYLVLPYLAKSYRDARSWFKANNVVPVADTEEIVVNGRKLGKQNPEMTPELRNQIRQMGSQELVEYLAQNPDVHNAIDEGRL